MFDWATFNRLFLLPVVTAGVVSWLVTPLVIKLANVWGMVDDPAINKHEKVVHEYPVPRGGGLAILAALVLAAGWWLPLDKHVLGILGGALVAVLVGLVDDRWDISPYWRLLGGNLLAALVVVGSGIGIAFLSNPFGPLAPGGALLQGVQGMAGQAGVIDLSGWRWEFELWGEMRSIWVLADLFAILWIVGLMNVVGMGAGGIEGQFPGVVAIAALVMGIFSLNFSADITQWPVIVLAGITAGAYLGFLPWNWYPQKIMPGYSGKSLGGYLLAVMAILSTAKIGILLVVLGVPVVDVGWAVVRRMSQGKSPVWGDRGHLHHRLLDLGWSKQKVVMFYWGVTVGLGVLALNFGGSQKLLVLGGLGLIIGAALWWIGMRRLN